MFFRRKHKNNKQSKIEHKEPIPKKIKQIRLLLFEQLEGCLDVAVQYKQIPHRGQKIEALFVYCRGLCDTKRIETEIVPSLDTAFQTLDNSFTMEELRIACSFPAAQEIETIDDIISSIFSGQIVLCIDGHTKGITFDIAHRPERQPEESNAELSIRGPRDGFIEDIAVNIALIRKRLKTPSLKMKRFTIGRRSQTTTYLLYLDDIVDKQVIDTVTQSLKKIDIDVVESGAQLAAVLQPRPFTIVPMFDYSGRPDSVVSRLIRGRFCLLIDGIPIVMIGPTNLTTLLKSAEDIHFLFLYPSFEYFLRLLGLVLALFLPAFWIAMESFHPEQIPFSLLSTIILSRRGVPFSPPLEAFIMLVLFELFREAGMRLPSRVGQTLSVVGGLIVGDAAIRAGLTSPSMVVMIAISFVASSTLINQALVGIIGLVRIVIALISSIFGIFGFILSAFAIIMFLAQLKSFGIPYLAPLSPFNWTDARKTLFRSPFRQMQQRPRILRTQDDTRQSMPSTSKEKKP